ncbi:MAG: hypothetical protein WCT02_00735 [Candidatus Paceibacterota bacterium]
MDVVPNTFLHNKYPSRGNIKVDEKMVRIPSFYYGKGITAVFPVSYKKIVKLVNSNYIKPARLSFSKALVNITIFDFYESPVGPYTEMVITVPVYNNPKINFPFLPLFFNKFSNKFGFHVLDIFQNTKIAVNHGDLLTGYPHNNHLINVKFCDENGAGTFVTVFDEAGTILSLSAVTHGVSKKTQNSYMTYYEKDEELYRIQMDVYAIEQKLSKCKIVYSDHPLMKWLCDLIDSDTSIQSSFYSDIVEVNPVTHEKLS